MNRKFTADQIFNGYEILDGPVVIITNPMGLIIDLVGKEDAGDGVQVLNGLLTPGFVNAHCHLELSHLKEMVPENTGLVDFVQLVMSKRASLMELKLDAMRNAEAEMYKSGIVLVGDICNTADSIVIKATSGLNWYSFIEVSGFTDAVAPGRLNEMKQVKNQFQDNPGHPRNSFSPHAPYSVSKALFQLLNEETAGQLVTIHNQESAAEDVLYQQKSGDFLALYRNFGIDITSFQPTGKTALQSWLPYFNKNQSIIAVHNSYTSEADIIFAQKHLQQINQEIFYCLCVNANQYIERKMPPIDLLRKHNCTLVIGTDSYASNHQLNILEELKTIQEDTADTIPLAELLKWATFNGAKALQYGHSTGSFEKGKTPGIVLVENLRDGQLTPDSSSRRII